MDRESLRYLPGVALGGVSVLAALLGVLLVIELREILAVLFLGVIVGVALTPLVDFLHRYHVPRVLSVLVIYTLIAGLLAGFLWYVIPLFIRELTLLTDRVEEFRARYEAAAEGSPLPPSEEVAAFLENQLGGLVENLVGLPFLVFTIILYTVTVFIVALLYTITRERMRSLFLSLMSEGRRQRSEEVLNVLGHRLRRYVVGEFITMLVVGTLSYLGLLLLGIPFPLVLATVAFIFEMVPIIGPWLSFFPAFAVALTQGIVPAVGVAILYLAIQQFENHAVVPLVQGRQVEMPALLIVTAVLIGGALMGVLGVLIAIPTAVILHTIAMEIVVPWRRRQVQQADARAWEEQVAAGHGLRQIEREDGGEPGT